MSTETGPLYKRLWPEENGVAAKSEPASCSVPIHQTIYEHGGSRIWLDKADGGRERRARTEGPPGNGGSAPPPIEWKRHNDRCLFGFVAGEKAFRISEHWTGTWLDKLDGKSVPVVCRTVQEAQEHAQGMM
jgi:hypothetical protein